MRPALSTWQWGELLGVGPQQTTPSRLLPAAPGPTPSGCPLSPTSHPSPSARASQHGATASPAPATPRVLGWDHTQPDGTVAGAPAPGREGTGHPYAGIRGRACNSPLPAPPAPANRSPLQPRPLPGRSDPQLPGRAGDTPPQAGVGLGGPALRGVPTPQLAAGGAGPHVDSCLCPIKSGPHAAWGSWLRRRMHTHCPGCPDVGLAFCPQA